MWGTAPTRVLSPCPLGRGLVVGAPPTAARVFGLLLWVFSSLWLGSFVVVSLVCVLLWRQVFYAGLDLFDE